MCVGVSESPICPRLCKHSYRVLSCFLRLCGIARDCKGPKPDFYLLSLLEDQRHADNRDPDAREAIAQTWDNKQSLRVDLYFFPLFSASLDRCV